jgi:heme A synthase
MSKRAKWLVWINILSSIFIIIWGAWVRLSGSGAGCGEHWPLCNGAVIPPSPSFNTFVEYTHRLTSGIFGITVLAQWLVGLKDYPKNHPFRISTHFVLFLTIVEALLGAFLVKKGLVVDNDSLLRAVVIGLHLVNTFLLLMSLTCSEYFHQFSAYQKRKGEKQELIWVIIGLISFALIGSTGAIAALGNTLFPESSLLEGIQNDFNSSSHFLIRLRIFHPFLAIAGCGVVVYLSELWGQLNYLPLKSVRFFQSLALFAILFGALNWYLLAPTWGALTHLFLADLLWMSWCGLLFRRYYPGSTPT